MDSSSLKVTSPYTQETLADITLMGWDEVSEKMEHAHTLFNDRHNWIPLHTRIEILEKSALLMKGQQDELAIQIAKEGGKPIRDARVEAVRAIDGVKLAIEAIRSEAGQVIPMQGTLAGSNKMAMTQKEPIGVVVAVSAFNHPLNLIVHQVVAAVAAGCPVLVKPAEDTPLSCISFVQTLHEAGLPVAWCQCVFPENLSVAEQMVTDPRVAFFSFIGSARVGWSLRSKLAPGTRCALEHGGAAPVIIEDNQNMDATVKAITKGGFYHAGQVCVSVQRVYVHESIADSFLAGLKKSVEQLTTGDPTSQDTDVGPLIRQAEIERVDSWVKEAIDEGAQCITGNRVLENQCYAPTILLNPALNSKVSTQEIFGPVVCAYTYRDLNDAIKQANALPYAFQASVFTASLETALHCYKHLQASAIMVNDHTAFRVDNMPFAGLKQSGLGVGGIHHTINDMQIEKMLVLSVNESLK